MNTFKPASVSPDSTLRALSWALGLLFILKSVDFFLSINLSPESELPTLILGVISLEAILFAVSGTALLLLALGTIRLSRWVRTSLYVVFVSNVFFIIYNTLLVPNWVDAGMSVIGAIILFFYLKKSKGIAAGRRLLGLQILTILTLLPATMFIILSVMFPDQALQDDSSLKLETADRIATEQNLYVTLTNPDAVLPSAADEAHAFVAKYPAQWDQARASELLQSLQPYVDTYTVASTQQYQCPDAVNNFAMGSLRCSLNPLRDYAQMMQFAALAETQRGNTILAEEYATAPIKVGLTMLESDNITLVEYLTGLASVNIGLDTLETLKNENALSRTAVRQRLAGVSIPTESLRTPLQREYLYKRIVLDNNLNSPQNYLYHPNRTRNVHFIFMSQVAENSTISCAATDSNATANEELNEYLISLRENVYNPLKPNIIGRMMLSIVLASLDGVRNNVCETNERINTLIN